MGINPKNRDDMFLAKAAGEEVDFSTIKPSTPVSDREKLLVQLGERIDNAGSGDGSTGGVLVVTVGEWNPDTDTFPMDKTFSEIFAAYQANIPIVLAGLTGGNAGAVPMTYFPVDVSYFPADEEYQTPAQVGVGYIDFTGTSFRRVSASFYETNVATVSYVNLTTGGGSAD